MISRLPWSCFSRLLVPIGVLVVLSGCGSPIEGSWRSDSKLPNGERDTIDFDGDLVGNATIWATPANDVNTWTRFKFDTDAYENEDGFSWLVKMSCSSGPCDGNDFKMDCEVIDSGKDNELEKMNCKGQGKWAGYPFDFERVE